MPRLPPVLSLVNEVADRAVLVGDPGRALALAPVLLERPLMSNHQRGLWGYTGTAVDGRPLTIQATGVGGTSAAVVVAELAAAGVARVVRAGTAVGVPGPVPAGELRVVDRAVPGDGASRALGADGALVPDAALHAGLRARVPDGVVVLSVDVLPGDDEDPELPEGVGALDLQTAAVLRAAARAGVAAAAVLAFPSGHEDDAARERRAVASGTAAAAALGATA